MKKNPIKSGLRETMAGKVTFLFLLFLYTGVMLYLFWMECYQVPGFQSDMPDYVNKVAGIAGNYEFPYPILFWTARLSAWLIGAKAAMAITAFQVADLPTGAVQLVPRCIAAAVFGVPCVGGQKPLFADFAFLRCMTNTQALKEIRPEHPHKGYIVHPLDQLRNFFAGTDGCHILNRVICDRHPGIALSDGELRREIAAEHSGKSLCGAVCFVAIRFFCKIKHGRLVFPKGVG